MKNLKCWILIPCFILAIGCSSSNPEPDTSNDDTYAGVAAGIALPSAFFAMTNAIANNLDQAPIKFQVNAAGCVVSSDPSGTSGSATCPCEQGGDITSTYNNLIVTLIDPCNTKYNFAFGTTYNNCVVSSCNVLVTLNGSDGGAATVTKTDDAPACGAQPPNPATNGTLVVSAGVSTLDPCTGITATIPVPGGTANVPLGYNGVVLESTTRGIDVISQSYTGNMCVGSMAGIAFTSEENLIDQLDPTGLCDPAPLYTNLAGNWVESYVCDTGTGNPCESVTDWPIVITQDPSNPAPVTAQGGTPAFPPEETFTGTLGFNVFTWTGAGTGFDEVGTWTFDTDTSFTKFSTYSPTGVPTTFMCVGNGIKAASGAPLPATPAGFACN